VALRLGINQEEAEALTAALDDAGLVRVGGGHSVTLEEAGRQLAKKE
jgi:Mn-dependent DtxR family transcriptional regulator